MIVTSTIEDVAVLHSLNAVVGTCQHVEGELTLMVGDHLATGMVYLVAVDKE